MIELIIFAIMLCGIIELFIKKFNGIPSLLSILISIPFIFFSKKEIIIYKWSSLLNWKFVFFFDSITKILLLSLLLLGVASIFLSFKYIKKNKTLYFFLLNFFITTMSFVLLSFNIFQFYIFWELMMLSSFFLIYIWGKKDALKSSYKYFLFLHLGSIVMLLGFVIIWNATGTANLFLMHLNPDKIVKLSYLMISFGFLVKMGVFPFHNWLPDAHSNAPTPVSILLSGFMVSLGAYAFIRFSLMLNGFISFVSPFLIPIAITSIIYGAILALKQQQLKRFLAFSTVSQMGYVLLGIGFMGIYGYAGAIYHIIAHLFAKGSLFFIAGIFILEFGTDKFSQLKGLAKSYPLIAFSAIIAAMSLSGIPPAGGFVSEFLIFLAGTKNIVAMSLALSLTIFSVYYLFIAIQKIFFGEQKKIIQNVPFYLKLILIVFIIFTLAIGIFPSYLVDKIMEALIY